MITPNVIFTRGNSGGLINIASVRIQLRRLGPEFTEWATELTVATRTDDSHQSADSHVHRLGQRVRQARKAANIDRRPRCGRSPYFRRRLSRYSIHSSWTAATDPRGGYSLHAGRPPQPSPPATTTKRPRRRRRLHLWRDTLGETVANLGDGADGDADGVIDDRDYTSGKSTSETWCPWARQKYDGGAGALTMLLTFGRWRCSGQLDHFLRVEPATRPNRRG